MAACAASGSKWKQMAASGSKWHQMAAMVAIGCLRQQKTASGSKWQHGQFNWTNWIFKTCFDQHNLSTVKPNLQIYCVTDLSLAQLSPSSSRYYILMPISTGGGTADNERVPPAYLLLLTKYHPRSYCKWWVQWWTHRQH